VKCAPRKREVVECGAVHRGGVDRILVWRSDEVDDRRRNVRGPGNLEVAVVRGFPAFQKSTALCLGLGAKREHLATVRDGAAADVAEEGQERVNAKYRGNYGRLAEINARYDPDNFFRVNQNIRPS